MNRKGLISSISALAIVLLLWSTELTAQGVTIPRGSQQASVSQRVGITDITITYHRPSVNEREIWGSLVPYGFTNLGFGPATAAPWRAGANENTLFVTTHDIKVEGQDLPGGTYGLHMAIQENGEVIVIFSKNSTAWGSFFYDEKEDALRVTVKSEEAPHRELLTFEFAEVSTNSATASLVWEKKKIPFNIEADVTGIVTANLKKELQSSPGFTYQNWNAAANFALNNDGDLEQALQWADASISAPFVGQKTFGNLSTKAQILAKMGKTEESKKVMDEALPMATILQIHGYGRQLITAGDKDKALEIFELNAEKNPDTWPVNYGLARGYSAKGDYKTALKYLEKALENAPAQPSKDRVQANIDKLKKGEDIN